MLRVVTPSKLLWMDTSTNSMDLGFNVTLTSQTLSLVLQQGAGLIAQGTITLSAAPLLKVGLS